MEAARETQSLMTFYLHLTFEIISIDRRPKTLDEVRYELQGRREKQVNWSSTRKGL
jgi:hypothetical protein